VKIYLAGPVSRRIELKMRRDQLLGLGHQVTSTWLDAKRLPPTALENAPWLAAEMATRAHADIVQSDALALFTSDLSHGCGAADAALGFAVALKAQQDMWVALIGPAENLWHCHPDVDRYAFWDRFTAHLAHKTGGVRAE
jgi:hypothetical protein